MRTKFLFVFLLLTVTASAHERGTLGIDMHFLLKPSDFQAFTKTRGADQLGSIINMGARLLEWVDVLQKDVPQAEREQIWRRIDRVGNEPTPGNPMYYNERIILENFEKVAAATPEAVLNVLRARTPLPTNPPAGFDVKTLVEYLRPLHMLYSRTSRWLVLYDWRYQLKKTTATFVAHLKCSMQKIV